MDYADEPPHSTLLTVQGSSPFNAEPTAASLVEFQRTPEDLVYCRNHGPVREFDEEEYAITVTGMVERELKLTVPELRAAFPYTQVVAALQVRRPPSLIYVLKLNLLSVRRKPAEGDGCHQTSPRRVMGRRCHRKLQVGRSPSLRPVRLRGCPN